MTVAELMDLLRSLGNVDTEGLGFSELEHGLQCAALLRAEDEADVHLQVAGLVHDIGHLFGDDATHGEAGARAVEGLLGPRIAGLVEAHVPAKRYLVATDPSYAESLSPVSRQTLLAQMETGGEVTPDALRLRRADDRAKQPGRVVPPLDSWIARIERVAR